jgi:mRNA interferase MazF
LVIRKPAYVPERGDVVWIRLDPQAGHEQAGRRPALVLSPASYNGRVGLALLCPITNRAKGYPFEVSIPDDVGVTGVVLADHVKNLDWRARKVAKIGAVSDDVTAQVIIRLQALLSGA